MPEPPALIPETLPEVRQVIPGRAVHVPGAGATVERLPAPPAPVEPPRAINLGIVQVESATRLSTRRGMVQLQGVEPVAQDAICSLADGRTPACHVLARTAVRRFVGRRSVACVLGLREDAALDHVANCSLGDIDLSLWVVAQGWAFAGPGANDLMRAAETTAREERRGLWDALGQERP
ncbi:MAG: hypothetical protein AAGH43_02995 [Pseudomonadota bacterium]